MELSYPLGKKGIKTSGFGYRKLSGEKKSSHHNGIDIGIPDGTSVLSVADGEVVRSDMKDKYGYGNFIIIKHKIDNNTFYSCYAHLTKRLVDVGDKVSKGQEIAKSGGGQGVDLGGGSTTGPHLHFEIRKRMNGGWIDPEKLIQNSKIEKIDISSNKDEEENIDKKDIEKKGDKNLEKLVKELKKRNIENPEEVIKKWVSDKKVTTKPKYKSIEDYMNSDEYKRLIQSLKSFEKNDLNEEIKRIREIIR